MKVDLFAHSKTITWLSSASPCQAWTKWGYLTADQLGCNRCQTWLGHLLTSSRQDWPLSISQTKNHYQMFCRNRPSLWRRFYNWVLLCSIWLSFCSIFGHRSSFYLFWYLCWSCSCSDFFDFSVPLDHLFRVASWSPRCRRWKAFSSLWTPSLHFPNGRSKASSTTISNRRVCRTPKRFLWFWSNLFQVDLWSNMYLVYHLLML